MTSRAVDRLQAELDAFCPTIAERILASVSAYQEDATARAYLGHSVRQNADQVIGVFRGLPIDPIAARNVGLLMATGTTVPLESVLLAFGTARDAFIERLEALAREDEDVSDEVARLRAAHDVVVVALVDEYESAKRRAND